ncbi:N-acetylmuramoyl-L-alanine amidase family protein [Paenibacillus sp. H1-7]|uniref:N-acetylmuramoyl-L-alanine amidase family protein n=1 Tax=Paenibacillus sp. H1-7 TaxID=2282849 RepID=UPI001EF788D5|nr:N-acetylmuramoyl-L-alanine amidase family protein [Paenibacillus sp. H1-7]
MMRVITALISMLLVSLLLFPMMALAAVQPIQLFLNGKQLNAEVPPRIIKNNTVVPVRIIAESLGSEVKWEEKSRKVTVDKSGVSIQLFIDKAEALVNNKSFKLETSPTIVEGSTMLPLRFVSEQFGVKVTWDDLTRSVFMFQNEEEQPSAGNAEGEASTGKDNSSGDKQAEADKPSDTKQPEDSKNDDKSPAKPTPTPTPIPSKPEGTGQDKGSTGTNASEADKPSGKPVDKPEDKPAGKPESGSKDDQQTSGDNGKETKTTVRSISLEKDQFVIKTGGAVTKPSVKIESNPDRIVIDIPNGQLDPSLKLNEKGEGDIKENHDSVTQIRYLLFSKESSIVRIIIDLNKKVDFRSSTATVTSQLSWTLSAAKDRYKVVIDPGHGGKDTGAISLTKRREKDFVLSLGTKVYKLLEKEPRIQPYMTRDDDTFVELDGRTEFANDLKADLFVSVHGNSAGKESVEGIETYYYTEQSLEFAKLMHEKLLKATQFNDRKVKQNNFYVIKNTAMPSLLLELGFLTNKSDEAAMYSEEFQDRVAASIVAAIKQQLNID